MDIESNPQIKIEQPNQEEEKINPSGEIQKETIVKVKTNPPPEKNDPLVKVKIKQETLKEKETEKVSNLLGEKNKNVKIEVPKEEKDKEENEKEKEENEKEENEKEENEKEKEKKEKEKEEKEKEKEKKEKKKKRRKEKKKRKRRRKKRRKRK
ncbi:hypothetical protein M0813_19716 [Anaeramoeba flamelloides]|uniref:Uncharacterized protein n=1 Tax=Anaeramoeba flamelloides TaxID=1746091 RepID=A0ABQ8YMX5_9EUKA|nr:hypothetical protein M0813_19716 [Anaeramoeba flamelloides]